ncbi:unnamed protein product, partial [Didymodactylos carnosus]
LVSDGWDTQPFELTEKNKKLFGRGSTDDKGPVLSWINVIEAYQQLNEPLPVNVKFVLESMEECGSEGLEDLLKSLKKTYLMDVDYVVISDSYWLGKEKPCLQYGLRGICYFFVEVECSTKDLHSGCFGGTIHEAMTDLVAILDSLVDEKGCIKINGMYDDVAPIHPQEEDVYKAITFDVKSYCAEAGVKQVIQENDKEKVLMHRWRYPSLSIHGIHGAFDGVGCKTVIPRKVTGKFSIRIVPNMKIKTVEKLIEKHVDNIMKNIRHSPNKYSVKLEHGGDYWVADFNDPQYLAARRATLAVHGIEPDLTREGGSIPITITFQELTGKTVLLLPIGASDDGAHSQNEKFDIENYMNGNISSTHSAKMSSEEQQLQNGTTADSPVSAVENAKKSDPESSKVTEPGENVADASVNSDEKTLTTQADTTVPATSSPTDEPTSTTTGTEQHSLETQNGKSYPNSVNSKEISEADDQLVTVNGNADHADDEKKTNGHGKRDIDYVNNDGTSEGITTAKKVKTAAVEDEEKEDGANKNVQEISAV